MRCPADDYWYGQILARRSHLLVRWVKGWLQRQVSHKGTYEGIADSLLSAIANLSVESRKRLLRRVPDQAANLYVRDLVAALAGDDEELVATLFARPELRPYQNTALRGRPDASWLRRATIALDHGLTAEQVVAACIGGLTGWTGSEADYWDGWVQDFHKLRKSRGRHAGELSRAGVRVYSSMRDRAAEAERHEEIYGRS